MEPTNRTGSVFGAKKIRKIHSFFGGSDSSKAASNFASMSNSGANTASTSSSTWYSRMATNNQPVKVKELSFTQPKLTHNPSLSPHKFSKKSDGVHKLSKKSGGDIRDHPKLDSEDASHDNGNDNDHNDHESSSADGRVDVSAGSSPEPSTQQQTTGKGGKGRLPLTMKSKQSGKL